MEAPEKTKDQPPNRIHLQFYGLDADDMTSEYGDEWCEAHETSYCVDQIYDTDIEYTRSDLCTMPGELVERMRAEGKWLIEQAMGSGDGNDLRVAYVIRDILAWYEGRKVK